MTLDSNSLKYLNNFKRKIIFTIVSLIGHHNSDTTAHSNKEDKSNKVTTISSSSTDAQYPSAKAVHDYISGIEDEISDIINGTGGS